MCVLIVKCSTPTAAQKRAAGGGDRLAGGPFSGLKCGEHRPPSTCLTLGTSCHRRPAAHPEAETEPSDHN